MPTFKDAQKTALESVDKAKSLREKADSYFTEASKRATDEKRDLKPDEIAEHEKLRGEATAACERAEADIALAEDARKFDALETWQRGSAGRKTSLADAQPQSRLAKMSGDEAEETRAVAFQAWFRCNSSRELPLSDEHEEACQAVGLNPRSKELVINLPRHDRLMRMQRAGWEGGHGNSFSGAEKRALSSTTGASGGYTFGESFVNTLEVNMLAFGGIMQAADIIRTASGEPMRWPSADDTSNSGRRIGSGAGVTSTAQPTFKQLVLSAHDYTSDAIKIQTSLLEDSAFNLPSIVAAWLGERLGRITNTEATTGNSSAGGMTGLIPSAAAGITTASSTAITWDEITNLIHSVDSAYRNMPGAGFMFSDEIYKYIRQLKDGVGRPLWAEGPNSTPPALLQGYPYFINHEMSSTVATGDVTVVFGLLTNYKIRMVNQVRFYHLDQLYRENDQDGYVAFMRADGGLLNPGTAPIKKMTQL